MALSILWGCGPEDPGPHGAGVPSGADSGLTDFTSVVCDEAHPNWTVGLISCTPDAAPGYTLFAPMNNRTTYLIDLRGRQVHSWTSQYLPGESAYLEPNGHLLRTAEDNLDSPFRNGGSAGRLQEFDWEGNLVWEFVYKSPTTLSHHDVERLPNGNIVLIAWESIDRGQALALGRDPDGVGDEMWAAHLIEVEPATNQIVWEWHILDHVIQDRDPAAPNYGVLADHPGRMDIDRTWGSFGGSEADWNHVNGVDYNEALDQLVISAHNQDEVLILDHSTTTAEAATELGGRYGRGGAFLYRWGRPTNYGVVAEQQLSGQHDPEWIPEGSPGAGNLLVFNNGNAFGYSAVFELELPLLPDGSYAFSAGAAPGPAGPAWAYSDPSRFFSGFISGSQRLQNGNTLICEGDRGRFFEVTPAGEVVWEYLNPVGPLGPVEQGSDRGTGNLMQSAFRADRYPPEYPAFAGRDLSPKGRIEL